MKRLAKKSGKKHKKWWILWVGLMIILGGCGVLLLIVEDPPVENIEDARAALAKAENLDAEVYSRNLYQQAKKCYDLAMIAWKKENKKFIVFRKYQEVSRLANQAKETGYKAVAKANEVRRNSKEDLKEEIKVLRQGMSEFEKIFAALPLASGVKDKHSKGKLFLNEAEIAFEKGEYTAGRDKSKEASRLILDAYKDARNLLDGYFERLPLWQKELQEAIRKSDEENTYVVVVEKIPSRCDVYYKGVKKYSFPAEFGRNWIGDKQLEGDDATPEGVYHVTKRLNGGSTKYYKALLIDYPNKNDWKNFAELKRNGTIPRNARPGGLIEIHGGGGRGGNWTNGCVGLKNSDMDQLYKHIEIGMDVVIIGASVPLDEALKFF